jgi:3-keto-5-aminohexanoate cleavage enzyme
MDKIVLMVAPCATAHSLQMLPDLPHTPEQIADEVVGAWNAGTAICHLHVLDEQGKATQDLTAFARTIELIRRRCDIVIEGSTGGAIPFSAADRSVALNANVEMASLNPGSVNFEDVAYTNSPQDIQYWIKRMRERNIKPDIAVFDTSWIANAIPYIEQGLIARPAFFSLVVGQIGAIPATTRHAQFLIDSLPAGSYWGMAGHNGHDLEAAVWAIALGGQSRAGFEDNPFYAPGRRASSNAELIDRLARIARESGREIASPTEARRLLGLPAPRSA